MQYLVHVKSDKIKPQHLDKFTPNKVYVVKYTDLLGEGHTLDDRLTFNRIRIDKSEWLKEGDWKIVKIQEIVSRDKILSFIENSKGKFICVWFIKKDGTKRRLIGRFGVKAGLKTESTPPTVDTNKYFVLYDTEVKGYRAVNKETIYEVSVGGKNYVVEG